MPELVQAYFPEFSEIQLKQIDVAIATYKEWNDKINVISRKDIENIEERHFLHSLGIYKLVPFRPGTFSIDVGTGGGFPGIPLAIANPDTKFLLVDSIGKKLKVAEAVVEACGLKNVKTLHSRVEQVKLKSDYVTGRAVETVPEFYNHVRHLLDSKRSPASEILYLKGGDFEHELERFPKQVKIMDLHPIYSLAFFETKKVVRIL